LLANYKWTAGRPLGLQLCCCRWLAGRSLGRSRAEQAGVCFPASRLASGRPAGCAGALGGRSFASPLRLAPAFRWQIGSSRSRSKPRSECRGEPLAPASSAGGARARASARHTRQVTAERRRPIELGGSRPLGLQFGRRWAHNGPAVGRFQRPPTRWMSECRFNYAAGTSKPAQRRLHYYLSSRLACAGWPLGWLLGWLLGRRGSRQRQ